MKQEVKKLLKEKGRGDIFTEERYGVINELMKLSAKRDKILNEFLKCMPDAKADFIADHMIKFVDLKEI